MATHNAKIGRAMRTRQTPTSKISGPLARCNVMITSSWTSGLESSGSWTRVTVASQPSNFPVASTRAGAFSRFWPEPVNTSAAMISVLYVSNGQLRGIAVRHDGGADLRRRLSYRVLQVAQVVLWVQAHGRVGGQHTEVLVVQRILGIDKHVHRQAVGDGVQLLEAHLYDAVVGLDLAQVHRRQRRRRFGQQVHGDQG